MVSFYEALHTNEKCHNVLIKDIERTWLEKGGVDVQEYCSLLKSHVPVRCQV